MTRLRTTKAVSPAFWTREDTGCQTSCSRLLALSPAGSPSRRLVPAGLTRSTSGSAAPRRRRVGVQTFVNISTDKAADPTCVLGYSKRVAERITADYADRSPGTYVSVRFGNVLGSRGSVITAFTEQIERGGPVTVTHPDVERYFMLIPEACQLVLQAAAIGADGEVMVLDMGTPVKIADVAKQLIRMSRKSGIEIVYTGLRPGEKLSEALFSTADAAQPSAHPMVTHVEAPRLDASRVTTVRHVDHEQARHWMADEAMAARDAAHA